MKLAAVPGVTSVSLRSVEETTKELLVLLTRLTGHDPTIEAAATQAAELAHRRAAGLVAVVEHPAADPGILVGTTTTSRVDVEEMRFHLMDSLREVTQAETPRGYPVVIIERILLTGAQLQAIVSDVASPRAAIFTLHSPTGRGWLELAGVAGKFVSNVDFNGS